MSTETSMILKDFLESPIAWKDKENVMSDDNGNTDDIDMDFAELPCGRATSSRSTSSESCDTESDLIVNPYIVRALDVIKFTIICDQRIKEVENITKPFKPTMAHQVFGPEEVIIGYRNLAIKFIILPNSFHTIMDYTFTGIQHSVMDGAEADDIKMCLQEWFPHLLNNEDFKDKQETENLMNIYGDIILTFPLMDKDNEATNIYITKCDPKDSNFLDFHKRFQALIVFYIDAASIIDFDDPNWVYYYVYKDFMDENSKVVAKLPIGFCTVYKFVLSKRVRISQFFILPNFQMRGIGTRLLGIIYTDFRQEEDFKYITVESPCEEFSSMRDKLDLHLVLNLPQFARKKVMEGYNPSMLKIPWKFSPEQVKHLAAILRYYYTRAENDLYMQFVKDMKLEFYNNYKRKLMRVNFTSRKEERCLKLRRIVDDDYTLNRTIHREVSSYIKRISHYRHLLRKLLSKNNCNN